MKTATTDTYTPPDSFEGWTLEYGRDEDLAISLGENSFSYDTQEEVYFFVGNITDPQSFFRFSDMADWSGVTERNVITYLMADPEDQFGSREEVMRVFKENHFDWVEFAKGYLDTNFSFGEYALNDKFPSFFKPLWFPVSIVNPDTDTAYSVFYKPSADYPKNDPEVTEYLYNLIFKEPIFCTVSDEQKENTVYLHHGLTEEYDWDREEVLAYSREILKLPPACLSWLEGKLPKQIK